MKALIVVDVQNDFIIGSLAVHGAPEIIDNINSLIKIHYKNGDCVIATMDCHPNNHSSFISNGGTWPDHCVVGTEGQKLEKTLKQELFKTIIEKGANPKYESYSGFFDEVGNSNKLHEFLVEKKVKEVYVCGLALDFCVKNTALDAAKLGYKVFIYTNATKAVFVENIDREKAILTKAGITFID